MTMPRHFFTRTARPQLVPGRGTGTLLLSMRGISDLVGYCMVYEFEDIVAAITGADRVMPGPASDESRIQQRLYKATRRLADDPGAFSGAVDALVSDEDRWTRASAAARQYAAAHFSGAAFRQWCDALARAPAASTRIT
jgi:hypothetical protein